MSYGDYIRERIAHTQKLNFAEGNPLYFTKCKEKPFKAFTLYGNAEGVENPEIIVCGKNLFDVNTEYTSSHNRAEAELLEDGTLRVKVSESAITNKWASVQTKSTIPLSTFSNDKVYVSADVKTDGSVNGDGIVSKPLMYLGALNSKVGNGDIVQIKSITPVNGKIDTEITINENIKANYDSLLICFYFNASENTGWQVGNYVDYSNIMISSFDTEYEPYKTPQKVALPYTFAENDYLTLLNKKVKTFINGVQTDITDSEIGQAILNLKCFEPSTTILCNSKIQPNNMYIKYISK